MASRLHFWQAALLGSLLVAAGLGVRSADAQQNASAATGLPHAGSLRQEASRKAQESSVCEFIVQGGADMRRHVGVDVWQMRCMRSVPLALRRLRLLYLSCGGPWVLRALPAPGRLRALAKDSRVGNALCCALSAPRPLPRWRSQGHFPAFNAVHRRREPAQPAARGASRRKCHMQGQDRAPAGRAPAGSLCQQLHGYAPGLPSVAHACAADAAAAFMQTPKQDIQPRTPLEAVFFASLKPYTYPQLCDKADIGSCAAGWKPCKHAFQSVQHLCGLLGSTQS